MKNNRETIEALVAYFGSQIKAAEALNVRQGSVSGWMTGKHGVSPIVALRAERITKGAIKSAELCPALAEKADAA